MNLVTKIRTFERSEGENFEKILFLIVKNCIFGDGYSSRLSVKYFEFDSLIFHKNFNFSRPSEYGIDVPRYINSERSKNYCCRTKVDEICTSRNRKQVDLGCRCCAKLNTNTALLRGNLFLFAQIATTANNVIEYWPN